MLDRSRILAFLVLAAGLGGSSGCNDPEAQVQTQRRVERMNGWLATARDEEADAPRRLNDDLSSLKEQYDRQVEQFNNLPQRIDGWYQNDVRDWKTHAPWHADRAQRAVRGDSEQARRTAIELIY